MVNTHTIFSNILQKYCSDSSLIDFKFKEIAEEYNLPMRFYHNFAHIESMLEKRSSFTEEIENIENLSLSIIYHDVIYNAKKGNNEEKSANFAKKHLKTLNFPQKEILQIENLIISTKLHKTILGSFDEKLLLDLDLMILGSSKEAYSAYAENIRKEYKFVPLFLYRRKRKEVLQNFLKTKEIYLTNYFINNFEQKARKNINDEIALL